MQSRAAHPQVLLMGFGSRDDPAIEAWAVLRERVTAQTDAIRQPDPIHAADEWLGIWRLLASNNREIARSAAIYGSVEGAKGDVARLQGAAPEMLPVPFRGPTGGMHGWYVTLGGSLAFTCARWYETGQLSLEAGIGAIQALGAAVVAEAPHEFRGRRR